ncbi:hypothetical protein H8A97_29905 [Bradyrhizobium sp. Arg62]|uniref:hypothetical protein n=1 Tax=Bradyrhizobium brasilense TaxID=1419277 RepID=UPI001E2D2A53|nr:hypothetical protein [Bradyrhizobium brasilense]MCC8949205.1 hypothetical protein [Bradyrhizobium brasilense]
MGAKLGDAGRARELARLFEEWRRAFDAGDERAARAARRAIDEALTEEPRPKKRTGIERRDRTS